MFKCFSGNKESFYYKASQVLLLILAFGLSFKYFVSPLIAVYALMWILAGSFRNSIVFINNLKTIIICWSFYLLHIIALAYTDNLNDGLKNLEVKLSLLLFPLLFSFEEIGKEKTKKIVSVFILGLVWHGIILIARAIYRYFAIKTSSVFFYEDFSPWLHPSYYSMYISFACVLTYFLSDLSKQIKISIYTLLTVILVLLSSKMGFIVHLLTASLLLIHHLKTKYNLKIVIATISTLIGLVIGSYFIAPSYYARFTNLFNTVSIDKIDKTSKESSAARMMSWDAANKLVKEKPIQGYSPGDANDELLKKYEELGYTGILEGKLNAHNQYFQTLVGLGFIGLFALLYYFFFLTSNAIKNKRPYLLFFVIIVMLHFAVESMLQAQAGTIFFGFFSSLFVFLQEEKQTV